MEWLGYRRVSRVGDRAETLISPEVQAERIESYAASRGLDVLMLEPELDVSGGKVERPILGAAIEAIERGEAAGIIVAQLDRLSRMDIADALHTIRRIEGAGAQVIAVAENFDAGTPEGRMGRNVFLAMGEMQLDRYKAQFRTAKARAVERGIWPVPVVPIGYEKGGDRKLYPGEKAPMVVRAFEMRAAGKGWNQIARLLGKSLSGARKVVHNRVYLGEINYGEWRNPEAHEPIVGRDLFEAAQLYHSPPRIAGNPQPLLGGLIRCAGCGFRMSAQRDCYKCRPVKAAGICRRPAIIGRNKIERVVRRTVRERLAEIRISASPKTDLLGVAQRKLESAEAELELYQEATRLADIGAQAFSRGMRSRAEDVEAARRELARARLAAPALEIPTFEELDEAAEFALLRGAIGVVWVRKSLGGSGYPADFRIIAAGFEPGEFGPIDWPDVDLPGQIRPSGA